MTGFLTKRDLEDSIPKELPSYKPEKGVMDSFAEWRLNNPGGTYEEFHAWMNGLTRKGFRANWARITGPEGREVQSEEENIKWHQEHDYPDKPKPPKLPKIEKTKYNVHRTDGHIEATEEYNPKWSRYNVPVEASSSEEAKKKAERILSSGGIQKLVKDIDNFINKQDPQKELEEGIRVEYEHGTGAKSDKASRETNVTDDDPIKTEKIAMAHLKELPDYYTRLADMEKK